MTDQTTLPETHSDLGRQRRLSRPVLEATIILAVFALVGAGGGWFWEHRWTPPTGVAYQGKWIPIGTGPERIFDGTGSFVVIAAIAGLVLGLICAFLFTSSEVGTVVAIVVGAALAAWLMHTVGLHLAPPDPAVRAKDAADLAKIGGTLQTYGDSYRVVFPGAAMLGATLVYLCFPARRRDEAANPPAS